MDNFISEAEGSSLERTVSNLKILLTDGVKAAPRELLPEDIQSNMVAVDLIVEEFVNGASVASWSNDGALQMLERWDEMREGFYQWSNEKETSLHERVEVIKKREKDLKESRIRRDNLSSTEIDIRKQINEVHQKRQDLEERQASIDKRIVELQERKQEISSEFDASKTKSSELDASLKDIMESKENIENDIPGLEVKIQNLESDQAMNADQSQHDQYVSWKGNVEKVMNEIQKARELEWKTWGPQEIIDWICRLDQGTFRVYKEKLEEQITSKIDNGEDLLYLLQDRQIIRELGVTKIRHRDMLIQHIERLSRNSPSKNTEMGENPNV